MSPYLSKVCLPGLDIDTRAGIVIISILQWYLVRIYQVTYGSLS